MKISVITPSYNQAAFIQDTLHSVISQNYKDLEYIVVDGASNDGSVEIIQQHQKNLAYWISEKDSGQSEAINKGLKKSTGEIIGWLNSDDMYQPETFANVEKTFLENPEVDLIYGDVKNFYPDGKSKLYVNQLFEPIDFLSRVSVHQPAVFWRKKLHDKIGYLDESLHYCMDYDLWMRIFFQYKTLKVNTVFACFRVHSKAKTAANPEEMYQEYRKIFSRFINSFPGENNTFKQQLKNLNIYANEGDIQYSIDTDKISTRDIQTAIDNYILNCAIQEYTWKNKAKANQLLKQTLSTHFFKTVFFMLKNNLL